GRIYEDGEGFHPVGGIDGGYRRTDGEEGDRAGHRHGSAAWKIRRAFRRNYRVYGCAEGERPGGFARAELRTRGVDVLFGRANAVGGSRTRSGERADRKRQGQREIRAGDRVAGRRFASD